ncbi:hypothetical protein HPB52_007985 [Rhipicephalus sanguineus]|uniref:Uncharacterized protein n=1 Tax=Rhipicephalus sanguineus TaxID=34632 RepID=A0A9D4Q5P1_RHISA|nr:hypothetical protein HPB52_007985 [Rhipicephalus sanguineus]
MQKGFHNQLDRLSLAGFPRTLLIAVVESLLQKFKSEHHGSGVEQERRTSDRNHPETMASAFLQPQAHFEPADKPQQAWVVWKSSYNINEQACEYANKPTATLGALLHVLGPHGPQTFPPPPPTTDGEQTTDQVTYLLEQIDALYRPYTEA